MFMFFFFFSICSLVKSNAFELQAIVIAFKGTAGFEDINSVAKQIAQKATTLKGQFNPKEYLFVNSVLG